MISLSLRHKLVSRFSDSDWDVNWADVGWVRDFFDHIHMEEGMVDIT